MEIPQPNWNTKSETHELLPAFQKNTVRITLAKFPIPRNSIFVFWSTKGGTKAQFSEKISRLLKKI